jgi:hypothetical protein
VIVLADPFADRLYLSHHRFQCTLQLRTQILGRLRLHPACVASAETFSVGLRQAARRVDQHHPCTHQSSSCPDHRQIRLGLRASMLHWTQQLWIDPYQSRKRFSVYPIILALLFFIAGLLVSRASWSLTHPAGDRPSHPICYRQLPIIFTLSEMLKRPHSPEYFRQVLDASAR